MLRTVSEKTVGGRMTIKAKYESGVFKPLGKVRLSEGTVVEIDTSLPKKKRRSLREFAFFGMWKDRTDFRDGLEYITRLRDKPRG